MSPKRIGWADEPSNKKKPLRIFIALNISQLISNDVLLTVCHWPVNSWNKMEVLQIFASNPISTGAKYLLVLSPNWEFATYTDSQVWLVPCDSCISQNCICRSCLMWKYTRWCGMFAQIKVNKVSIRNACEILWIHFFVPHGQCFYWRLGNKQHVSWPKCPPSLSWYSTAIRGRQKSQTIHASYIHWRRQFHIMLHYHLHPSAKES